MCSQERQEKVKEAKSKAAKLAERPPMLIIFGGLPGAGKTTIARELARRIAAVHLRIDSIEQAIRCCAAFVPPLDEAGYRAAYAVAEDNLCIGRTVVADSVNPVAITREAWLEVARRAQAGVVEIEVTCSNAKVHRNRVEGRSSEIPGLKLPTWHDVMSREYDPWNREHLMIDTAARTVEENVSILLDTLAAR